MQLRGSLVALVTPFSRDRLDEEALRRLVDRQIDAGTAGIVVCGTTGEAATMSPDERERALKVTVEQCRGRVPVVMGTGTNDTAETLRRTCRARELGADAALVVTPYYNKPTQEGLYRHYRAVVEGGGLPVVLYDVPSRTGVGLSVETVARLAELPGVVAVKDATGCLKHTSDVIEACGERPVVLSGDDALTLPMIAIGGRGVISVTANVAPREMAELVDAALAGDLARARDLHVHLLALHRAMFLESNPIPAKTALAMMGLASGELRLPLCPMEGMNRELLRQILDSYGLV